MLPVKLGYNDSEIRDTEKALAVLQVFDQKKKTWVVQCRRVCSVLLIGASGLVGWHECAWGRQC